MKIIHTQKTGYPSISGCGVVDITTVLIKGEVNDYAAYSGDGPEEWVAAHGDKLSETEALAKFPFMREVLGNPDAAEAAPDGTKLTPSYRQ